MSAPDYFAIGSLIFAGKDKFIDDERLSMFEKRTCFICRELKYDREFFHSHGCATAMCLDCCKKKL